MPRIPPSLIHRAYRADPRLAQLLPVCRTLECARNELRWLQEHACSDERVQSPSHSNGLLAQYGRRRAKGEPLQYILGSEYFGDLEIKCRPGVLIPRQETAASVSWLVDLLAKQSIIKPLPDTLRVLDLCTGSGCIPLLFHHEFHSKPVLSGTGLELVGVDISPHAIRLSNENKKTQVDSNAADMGSAPKRTQSLHTIKFLQADILAACGSPEDQGSPSLVPGLQRLHGDSSPPRYDVLISNPPYISTKAYKTTTSASVRKFEPILALVPKPGPDSTRFEDGDLFYPRLLDIADVVKARVVMFEVADMAQAERVATMAVRKGNWDVVQIWRDDPTRHTGVEDGMVVGNVSVRVLGCGHGRTVFAYRKADVS